MIEVNEIYSYIPSNDEPLSADVGIIKGKDNTYIYDVGCLDNYLQEINNIENKTIIISHFHPDHMGNLKKINIENLYVSNNTFKYSKKGTIVDEDLYIDDGVKIHIFLLPSSHAKGCLGLEVNEEYVFVGDGICGQISSDGIKFNVQLLNQQINVLENIKAKYLIQSHHMNKIYDKQNIINSLEKIYEKRNKEEAYIKMI